jgi:hypothetical protein
LLGGGSVATGTYLIVTRKTEPVILPPRQPPPPAPPATPIGFVFTARF